MICVKLLGLVWQSCVRYGFVTDPPHPIVLINILSDVTKPWERDSLLKHKERLEMPIWHLFPARRKMPCSTFKRSSEWSQNTFRFVPLRTKSPCLYRFQAWNALATCYEQLGDHEKALQVEVMGAHLKSDADQWFQLGQKSRLGQFSNKWKQH
jgi:hypothetical protein